MCAFALRNLFIFSRSRCVCTVPNDLILTHTVHVTDDGVYIKKMVARENEMDRKGKNKKSVWKGKKNFEVECVTLITG